MVGQNISQTPRGTEKFSFKDLRALAENYDAIQLCERVLLDFVSRIALDIEPRPDLIKEDLDASIYDDDIQFYKDFFAFPDKEHDLRSWLRMALRDQFEIDALAIFVRKNKAGGVYSLDIIDGATIKPLIDDRGRRPLPPYPAYEQFWEGLPSTLLTSDDLLYVKETEQTDSVYGHSRVERIILKVNQALRKQTKDLARFTDGTLPAGVVELPVDLNWTQDETEAFEEQFNNLMAGNDQQRARIKVLPRGMTYKPTDDPELMTEFDSFLLNATAACFGLTMAELGMTENVNKSSGDSQENVVYRRALGPLLERYADLFTHILKKYFGEDRFVVRFKGFEEAEDFNAKVMAYSSLITSGILSPTQAARELHLPVYEDMEVPPFVMTTSGPFVVSDLANKDLRDAQVKSQLAGYQLAQQQPSDGKGEEDSSNDDADDQSQDTKEPPKNESDPHVLITADGVNGHSTM